MSNRYYSLQEVVSNVSCFKSHLEFLLNFLTFLLFLLALLTVSEEVRSRCSLKHRKSLLLTDISMENVPMDTYPVHHGDPSYRSVAFFSHDYVLIIRFQFSMLAEASSKSNPEGNI